jgi:NAD(P)-dependent dehydrogenase (short-subunit alcohol dehydrogenase family)
MGRVENKVAIVTGAASGIGKATSILLAREGATVALTDVSLEQGREVASDIEKMGGKARFWQMDVSKEAQVKAVFKDVAASFGKIDVLVNNAGIGGSGKPTDEETEAGWDALMAVNVKGVFFCTKHAIPYMKLGGGGSIINLSSIYGLVGAADAPSYHASKGAVRLMAKTDAMLYAKDKIRVNSVHPGFIRTPLVINSAQSPGDAEERLKYLASLHPLGHIGEPEDVAYGILYLASDESSFVTGSELVIDGGYTAR